MPAPFLYAGLDDAVASARSIVTPPHVTAADLAAAFRGGDRARVNEVAAALIARRTPLGDQWAIVADALLRSGEIALALAAADRRIADSGGAAPARFARAVLLARAGRQEEAALAADEIPEATLPSAQRDHFRATCLLESGAFDEAATLFRRVLSIVPANGAGWLSLASIPADDPAALIADMDEAATAVARADPLQHAQWHYARAIALQSAGRSPDAVFAAFAEGARRAGAVRKHDPAADSALAASLLSQWDAARVTRYRETVEPIASPPIFVTGIPRSGTTLVEQMLTAHPAIAGGGEMPFAALLANEAGGAGTTAVAAFAGRTGGLARLARLYRHLVDERFGADARIVDKTLAASRLMGVLAPVLPEARFVWLRRDPLDCAWSCFRTYFAHGVDWSWSLAHIAHHFRLEDALYTHWQRVLGDRMLTVRYEELVDDPKAWADRILAHAGLDPDPAVYAPHIARRSVTTASVTQVRQPIGRGAVGSAEPFRRHLQPFIDAYAG